MSAATGTRRRGVSQTRPDSPDPRLRGRTYAVPFEAVWTAAVGLAGGGLPRWRVVEADDEAGRILVEVTSWMVRRVYEARISIRLDENAQTRVDITVGPREGPWRSGSGGRRLIASFLRALDRHVASAPGLILDPTSPSPHAS